MTTDEDLKTYNGGNYALAKEVIRQMEKQKGSLSKDADFIKSELIESDKK